MPPLRGDLHRPGAGPRRRYGLPAAVPGRPLGTSRALAVGPHRFPAGRAASRPSPDPPAFAPGGGRILRPRDAPPSPGGELRGGAAAIVAQVAVVVFLIMIVVDFILAINLLGLLNDAIAGRP